MWPNITITDLRWTSDAEYGWLNYKTSAFGEIVDKYKFEAGCITEHVRPTRNDVSEVVEQSSPIMCEANDCGLQQWDEGEIYPSP